MHLRTHTKPESIGQAGRWQSPYHPGSFSLDLVMEKLAEGAAGRSR
jgi:arylsulfatase